MRSREVVTLRPIGISPSDQLFRAECEDETDGEYLDMMQEIISKTSELIRQTAEELNIIVHTLDYDLPPDTGIPSRHASRWIKNANMISVFDPTNAQLGYIIGCMRDNPVLSALLSCSDADYLVDHHWLINAQTATLLKDGREEYPRIFPVYVRPDDEEKSLGAIKSALLYPYEAA